MAALIDLNIAGRTYQVACREGEEENLRSAARLVDGKSREALAGLGTLSESRQFLFAALLLADQLIDKSPDSAPAVAPPPPEPAGPDPELVSRAESAGLIAREQSQTDARVAHLRLTREGERRLELAFTALGTERAELRAAIAELDADKIG